MKNWFLDVFDSTRLVFTVLISLQLQFCPFSYTFCMATYHLFYSGNKLFFRKQIKIRVFLHSFYGLSYCSFFFYAWFCLVWLYSNVNNLHIKSSSNKMHVVGIWRQTRLSTVSWPKLWDAYSFTVNSIHIYKM